MNSLIIETMPYHHECFGMALEYILSKGQHKKITCIFYFNSYWIIFFKKLYEHRSDIHIQICNKEFPDLINILYDYVFYITPPLKSNKYKYSKEIYYIYHNELKRNGLPNSNSLISIRPFSGIQQIPFLFSYRNIVNLENIFHPTIYYFITTSYMSIDFEALDLLLESLNIKILFICKRFDNLYALRTKFKCIRILINIPTEDLIRCFLYKKCIFYPKPGSAYETERTSGCIHLAASFKTPLYLPKHIADLYDPFPNFKPFSTDDELKTMLQCS